ncbi:unnamed protein product [Nippostrongylus brasiliensis]|uniref:Lysosome membrane protein 2 (inferred by orthology to a human protein) n=1 Tax=Nippostrongylus brasiliensis TaxID=27835 RepID=A0A0N4XX65_NIPBR|nr:unnamed protein product [Nippostrongylus brasiliensis]
MEFAQATRYVYNPSKSCQGCDPKVDTVTIPDISFFIGMTQIDALVVKFLGNQELVGICQMVLKEKCAELAALLEREIGTFMDLFRVGPFVTVTIDQLMFSGYVSPLVTKLADRIVQISNKLLGTKFGPVDPTPFIVTLNSDNGTTDTLYTTQTGKTDYSRSGYVVSFTNMSNMSLPSNGDKLPTQWWPGAETTTCNSGYALMLEGTSGIIFYVILEYFYEKKESNHGRSDGDFFKSFIDKTEELPIYISDVCRTAKLVFEKEVTVSGITGYRYLMPSSAFDYSIEENCGFCNPNTLSHYGAYDRPVNTSCLPSGLLDISGCQGSPIIMSKPHFYQASDIVRSFVPRFKATYDNDETTLDIEPLTGTVLSANKRLQINMLLNQFSTIGAYSVLRPGAYPIVWLNESFLIDDGTRNDLMSSLFTPKYIVEVICWCAIGLGGFLMILAGVIFIVNVIYRNGKEEDFKSR